MIPDGNTLDHTLHQLVEDFERDRRSVELASRLTGGLQIAFNVILEPFGLDDVEQKAGQLEGEAKYLYLATTATDLYLMACKALCSQCSHYPMGNERTSLRDAIKSIFLPPLSKCMNAILWLTVNDLQGVSFNEATLQRQMRRFLSNRREDDDDDTLAITHVTSFFAGYSHTNVRNLDGFGGSILPNNKQRLAIMRKILLTGDTELSSDVRIGEVAILSAHKSVMADYNEFAAPNDIRRAFHEKYVPALRKLLELGHLNVIHEALMDKSEAGLMDKIVAARENRDSGPLPIVQDLQFEVRRKGIPVEYPFDLLSIHNFLDMETKLSLWDMLMRRSYTWGAKGRKNSLMAYHTFESTPFPMGKAVYIIGGEDKDVVLVEQSPEMPHELLKVFQSVVQFMMTHQYHILENALSELPPGTKKYTIKVIFNAIATVIATGKEGGYKFHNDVNVVITSKNNEDVGTIDLTNAQHMQSATYTLFDPDLEDEPYAKAAYEYQYKDEGEWKTLHPTCGTKHRFGSNSMILQGPGSQQDDLQHAVNIDPDGKGKPEHHKLLTRLIMNFKMAITGELLGVRDVPRVGSLVAPQGHLSQRVAAYLGPGREHKGHIVNNYRWFDESVRDILCSDLQNAREGRPFCPVAQATQEDTSTKPVPQPRIKRQHRPEGVPEKIHDMIKSLVKEIRVPTVDRDVFKKMYVAHKSDALVSSGDPATEIATHYTVVRKLLYNKDARVKVVVLPSEEDGIIRHIDHPSTAVDTYPWKTGQLYTRKAVYESLGVTYSAAAEMRTHQFINGKPLENAIACLSKKYKNEEQVESLAAWVLKFRHAIQTLESEQEILALLDPMPGSEDATFSTSGTGGSARPAGTAPLSMRKGANEDGSFGYVAVLCNGQKIASDGNHRLQEMTRQGHVITYFLDVGAFFADDTQVIEKFASIAHITFEDMSSSMLCLGRFVCNKFTYDCPIEQQRGGASTPQSARLFQFDATDLLDDGDDEHTDESRTQSRCAATEPPPSGHSHDKPHLSTTPLTQDKSQSIQPESQKCNVKAAKPPPEAYLPELIGKGAEAFLARYGFDADYLNSGHYRFYLTPWVSPADDLKMERKFSSGKMDKCDIVYVDGLDKKPLEVPLPSETCQNIVANKAAYNIHMARHDFVRENYYEKYKEEPTSKERDGAAEEESEETVRKSITVAQVKKILGLSAGLLKLTKLAAFANASSAERFLGNSLSQTLNSVISHPLRETIYGSLLQVYGVVTTTSRSDLHGAMNLSNAAVLGLIESSTNKEEYPLIKRLRISKLTDIDKSEVRLFLQNVILIRCTGCLPLLSLFRIVMAQPEMRTGQWANVDLNQIPPFGIPSLHDDDMRKLYREIVRATFWNDKCTTWVLNQHKSSLIRTFKHGYGDMFIEFLTKHVVDFADKFIGWCDNLYFTLSDDHPYDGMLRRMEEYLTSINDDNDVGFLAQAIFNDIRAVFHFTALEEWVVVKDSKGQPCIQQVARDGTLVTTPRDCHPNREILRRPQRVHMAFGSQQFVDFLKSLTGCKKLSLDEVYDTYLDTLDKIDCHTLKAMGVAKISYKDKFLIYYLIQTGEILSIILFEHIPCLGYGVIKYRFPHFGMSSCPLSDKAHVWPATVGCGSDKYILDFDPYVPSLRLFFEIVADNLREGVRNGLVLPQIADHRPKDISDMPPGTDTVERVLESMQAVPICNVRGRVNLNDIRPPEPKQKRKKPSKKRKTQATIVSDDTSSETPARQKPRRTPRIDDIAEESEELDEASLMMGIDGSKIEDDDDEDDDDDDDDDDYEDDGFIVPDDHVLECEE